MFGFMLSKIKIPYEPGSDEAHAIVDPVISSVKTAKRALMEWIQPQPAATEVKLPAQTEKATRQAEESDDEEDTTHQRTHSFRKG